MPKTIGARYQTDIKILRSHFIATIYPAQSAAEIKSLLLEHNQLYSDATHNCYAYILGYKQETTYYADAGEPSGTAGKPILNELLRSGLTNVLAVVTRYYGGIKLGVKGLIDAYGEAVAMVIASAELVEVRNLINMAIECDYPTFESLKHKAEEWDTQALDIRYSDWVRFTLPIPDTALKAALKILDGYKRTNRLNYYQKE